MSEGHGPGQPTQESALVLQNSAGVQWLFAGSPGRYAWGSIAVNDVPLEAPLHSGLFFLRNSSTGEERWICAQAAKQVSGSAAELSGREEIDGVTLSFRLEASLSPAGQAACADLRFTVDTDLSGWDVCLAYHAAYAHAWTCHLYPFAEDAKAVAEPRLTYLGVPAALMYRDDPSLAVLFGIDPGFDYLNPTTWTRDWGFFFTDGAVPAQFRVGAGSLKPGIDYRCPLQIIISHAGSGTRTIPSLVRQWIALNEFRAERLHVRSPESALELFARGRRNTTLWHPGIGYKLEEGDPESNFVYMGEQPLSAYFEYLLFEGTGDPLWRQRCFEQMDFLLAAQNADPSSVHYGAMHTAYDLGKRSFDSDDRGNNIGYKPDINVYMARYMLQTWNRVKQNEGLDRREWYDAALRAANWAMRQRNPDGGLPQKIAPDPRAERGDAGANRPGDKSISSTPGRALPAFQVIHEITGDRKYEAFAEQLERYVRDCVEGRFRFTGHHPDLPPDELEEASIWGLIEYWLDKYERTHNEECLERAVADAYLAFLWWCPKQLSWVKNPTQLACAEQQHFLQYSIYCYQNRKVECLRRLHDYTGEALFQELFERVLQGILWTQVTDGNLMGATHERIADPWLARDDYGEPASFDSLGTVYMGEQSLDCMLQILEMSRAQRSDASGPPD